MKKAYDKLTEEISNCEEDKTSLGNMDFIDDMGDFFFSDNKKRRKAYKKSIQGTIDLYEDSKQLANDNQNHLVCIKALVREFQCSFFMALIFVEIRLGITLPNPLKKSIVPPLLLVLGTFIGIAMTYISYVNEVLNGVVTIFVFVIIEEILMVTAGIMRGYERKKCFEEGTKAYNKKMKVIRRKVYEPLQEMSKQLESWYKDQLASIFSDTLWAYLKFLFVSVGLALTGGAMLALLF